MINTKTTGNIRISDINTELGNSSSEADSSLGDLLTEMGEGTNPDSMSEAGGYDADWDSWLEPYDTDPNTCDSGNLYNLYVDVRNNSTEHSYSETIYYDIIRTGNGGGSISSGSASSGTIAASDEDAIFLGKKTMTAGDISHLIYIRFDTGASWTLVDSIIENSV